MADALPRHALAGWLQRLPGACCSWLGHSPPRLSPTPRLCLPPRRPADKLGFTRSAIQVRAARLQAACQLVLQPGATCSCARPCCILACRAAHALPPAPPINASPKTLQAAPSPVTLVVIKGENTTVDVKKLPKKVGWVGGLGWLVSRSRWLAGWLAGGMGGWVAVSRWEWVGG